MTPSRLNTSEHLQEGTSPRGEHPVVVTLQGRKVEIEGNPETVVYSWCFQSVSNPDKSYDVILRRSGEVSCPCPSWIFKKSGKARGCKHIDQVQNEIYNIRNLFKTGQPLPMYEAPAPSVKAQKKAAFQPAPPPGALPPPPPRNT